MYSNKICLKYTRHSLDFEREENEKCTLWFRMKDSSWSCTAACSRIALTSGSTQPSLWILKCHNSVLAKSYAHAPSTSPKCVILSGCFIWCHILHMKIHFPKQTIMSPVSINFESWCYNPWRLDWPDRHKLEATFKEQGMSFFSLHDGFPLQKIMSETCKT